MNYYKYRQGNPGGSFDYSSEKGISVFVYIEAPTAREANKRAVEEIGIYFDGVDSGVDCVCCGNRWTRADDDCYWAVVPYEDVPTEGVSFEEFSKESFGFKWMRDRCEAFVHPYESEFYGTLS